MKKHFLFIIMMLGIVGGHLPVLAEDLKEIIPVNENSRLCLTYASDPELDIFYNSFGFFYESEGKLPVKALSIFNPDSRLKFGFVNMSNYEDFEQSDLEKTLLLVSSQLGFNYKINFGYYGDLSLFAVLADDIFIRTAYNMYDLAPSIRSLSEGKSLLKVLSNKTSGISYSTVQNLAKAQIGFGSEIQSVAIGFSTHMTDFFYSDYSVELSLTGTNIFKAVLAYDWAQYDTLNGVSPNAVRTGLDLYIESGGVLSIEAQYKPEGTWNLGFMGSISLDTQSKGVQEVDNSSNKSFFKVEKEYSAQELYKASMVGWDQDLANREDLSISEIGAILYVNQVSKKYDYNRVVSLNYKNMRSLEKYISKGGICRDAANAIANLLSNNGYQSKIVYSKQAYASPHAYVAAQDENGSFYIFNYEMMYQVPGAGNFGNAAASYSQYLSLYLLDPETHDVTDILISPDLEYLESIAGMSLN